jgi:hypothetical protein
MTDFYNSILAVLDIKDTTVVDISGELAIISGSNITKLGDNPRIAFDNYMIKRHGAKITIEHDITKIHIGESWVGFIEGKILDRKFPSGCISCERTNLHWCSIKEGMQCIHSNKILAHPMRKNYAGISIEEFIDHKWVPIRYAICDENGCRLKGLTASEWKHYAVIPAYLPNDIQYPADITLPNGKTVHCPTVHHAPRFTTDTLGENRSAWAAKHGIKFTPGSNGAKLAADYAKYEDEVRAWRENYEALGRNSLRLEGMSMYISTELAKDLSFLVLKAKPTPPRDSGELIDADIIRQ